MPKLPLARIILARIPDYLPLAKRIGFAVTKGRRIPKVAPDPRVRWWRALMGASALPAAPRTLHFGLGSEYGVGVSTPTPHSDPALRPHETRSLTTTYDVM